MRFLLPEETKQLLGFFLSIAMVGGFFRWVEPALYHHTISLTQDWFTAACIVLLGVGEISFILFAVVVLNTAVNRQHRQRQ
jgi:hypothetical protein